MKRMVLMGVLSGLVLAGCATAKLTNGVPNLSQVDAGVWRGGEPTAAGWAWLWSQGVSNVVMLDEWCESKGAPGHGMVVKYLPVTMLEQMATRPKDDVVREAVRQLTPGTFVHCLHGNDRTGLVVGCYRLKQGWSKDKAWREMLANGFHVELQGLYGYWLKQREEDWR